MGFYMGVVEDPRLAKLLEKPNLRILTVVRDHMSGLLYSVPYLRALREHFPQAKIMLLANPYATPVLQGCPYIDEIVPFFQFYEEEEPFAALKNTAVKGQAWTKLVSRVDLVVHFRNVGGSTMAFCAGLGKPYQVGYEQGRFNNLLDLNLGHEDIRLESRLRNGIILEAIGLPTPSTKMEMWLKPEDEVWVENYLKEQGWQEGENIIVFHPGCHWGCNQWLNDRWSQLGDALHEKYGGKIIITGAPDELPLAEKIASEMKVKPIISVGATSLMQFAALLGRADLVIAVDTAPTQICMALDTPAIIIKAEDDDAIWNNPLAGERMKIVYGTDPERGDWDRCDFAAGACNGPQCRSRMMDLTPEGVVKMAESFLNESLQKAVTG